MVGRVSQQSKGRSALSEHRDDFYPTPPIAVEKLLDVEEFDGTIWEPACGDGAIVNVLRAHDYEVVATDLVDRGLGGKVDFLMEWQRLASNIVTNPPYTLADQFVEHGTNLGMQKMAFLLRLVWLAGQRRRKFFEACPPIRVWVFSGRLPRMHRGDWTGPQATSTVDFAWFVFERGFVGAPSIGWI